MKSVRIVELEGMYAVLDHDSQFHKPVKGSLQPDKMVEIRDKPLGKTSAIFLSHMQELLRASLGLVCIYMRSNLHICTHIRHKTYIFVKSRAPACSNQASLSWRLNFPGIVHTRVHYYSST
jgi:hypothetical protein